MKVCVVGRGKVGSTLVRGLREAGVDTVAAAGRGRLPTSHVDVWVLAVPDARIRDTAERIAARVSPRTVVLHCAGARGPEELAACRDHGAAVAGFHPLVSFASRARTPSLRGATFVVDGDARAERAARRLTRALGAHCVAQHALGPAYHAAAALVANGAAALATMGVELLVALGFSQRDAERGLAHLLGTVAHNVAHVGVPAALTGPVVRGDADTVARHLEALAALDPRLRDAYASVQPLVLHAARGAGLDATRARAITRVLHKTSRTRRERGR